MGSSLLDFLAPSAMNGKLHQLSAGGGGGAGQTYRSRESHIMMFRGFESHKASATFRQVGHPFPSPKEKYGTVNIFKNGCTGKFCHSKNGAGNIRPGKNKCSYSSLLVASWGNQWNTRAFKKVSTSSKVWLQCDVTGRDCFDPSTFSYQHGRP